MGQMTGQTFFEGKASNDPAFSARDRITRGPKALGFVDLDPVIRISKPGQEITEGSDVGEILLRQLLKFQLPSPYHRMEHSDMFRVKPYLEVIRLIKETGPISFDELCLFGMQLTDHRLFEEIVSQIERFRHEKKKMTGSYKKFIEEKKEEVMMEIYDEDIKLGNLRTRENKEISISKFISTKYSNQRDYTDACIRYLRETGMISISGGIQSSISIREDRIADAEFILRTIDREPLDVGLVAFKNYLFDTSVPVLYTDNEGHMIEYLMKIGPFVRSDLVGLPMNELKKIKREAVLKNRESAVIAEKAELRTYQKYTEIMNVYDNLNETYDPPLMLEWNTWRAMTMINDGEVVGNFKLDDLGEPLSTAQGNKADIICDYDGFGLTVEVTLRSGSKQFDAEGESVVRHLGNYQTEKGKKAFCLFIARQINSSSKAYFYSLYRTNLAAYGGRIAVVPITLDDFRCMIDNARNSGSRPSSGDILSFLEYAEEEAHRSEDEEKWFSKVSEKARHWMR